MLSAASVTEREVLDRFDLTGLTPREAQSFAYGLTCELRALLFNQPPSYLPQWSSISSLPKESPDFPWQINETKAAGDVFFQNRRASLDSHTTVREHNPVNSKSASDGDEDKEYKPQGLPSYYDQDVNFAISNVSVEEEYRDGQSAPSIMIGHIQMESNVSAVPSTLRHCSTAPNCLTRGIPSIDAVKGQPGKQRRHQRQDSNAVHHQSSFLRRLARKLRLPYSSSNNQISDDELLRKAHETYSFVSNLSWSQPQNVVVHNWRRTSEIALHNAMSQWLQKAKHSCIGINDLLACGAWMELIDGVKQRKFQNCFLGGDEQARPVCIDSSMAQFANFSWIETNDERFLIWRGFARRVTINKKTSILHATGDLHMVTERDVARAVPLPEVWSIGLNGWKVPTGEEYICEYFERILLMKNTLLQRDTQGVESPGGGIFLREMYDRLSDIKQHFKERNRVRQEISNHNYRLQINETGQFFNQYTVQVTVESLTIIHSPGGGLGVRKLKQRFNVRPVITSRLASQPGARYPFETTLMHENYEDSFEQNVITLLTHALNTREEFVNLRDTALRFQMNLHEFAKVHILGALAYDQNLITARHDMKIHRRCVNEYHINRSLNLRLLCASGCVVQDENCHVKAWHGTFFHIDRFGYLQAINREHDDGIQTERSIFCGCPNNEFEPCFLLRLLCRS